MNELVSPILKAKAEVLTIKLRKKHKGLVIGIGKMAHEYVLVSPCSAPPKESRVSTYIVVCPWSGCLSLVG